MTADGEPTIREGSSPSERSHFGDVEDERLFEQVRARLFAHHGALKVGRYRVLRRLGAGAMGEVQLGIDADLDRLVAIKFVHTHLASRGWAERLRTEARALARLAHPNVVHVYEVGEHEGRVYLAMEYIEGTNLREWIRATQPSWTQVLEVYLAAGRGLAAAHGAGVVHRDFKPENILRGEDGRIAVADFGLAALEQGASTLDELRGTIDRSTTRSRTDEIKGTPAYMPPEQFRGRSDARADQFCLCVSLYEGLWGQRPFMRSALEIESGTLADPEQWIPRPPPRDSVPSWLWPILRRGLAYDPDDRWPDLDSLLAAIERRLLRRGRRARWLGSGAAALGVGLLSGVIVARMHEPTPVDACATVERELDGTWDSSRREQLLAAFSRAGQRSGATWIVGSAPPVIAGLDRWRDRWLSSRVELCQARSGGDPVILDRVGTCLERQRRSTSSAISLLLGGELDTLGEAPMAVQRLADPRSCEHEARYGGPPEPRPAIAEAVERLRAKLTMIEAELLLGRHHAASVMADALVGDARMLDHPPIEAELAQLRGRALLSSQPERGLELLEQAADLGEGSRHDLVVAESWRWMAMFAATEQSELERGRQWLRRADAAATRIGVDPLGQARLDFIRGHLRLLAREFEPAIALFEASLAVFEQHDDLVYGSYSASALGLALLERGEQRRAVELFEQALERLEQVYGPRHPAIALAAYNLGQVLIAEQPELAPALLERAVEIWQAAESVPNRDLGRAHFVLAQLALDGGRFELGREHARAAAEVFAEVLPAEDISHAETSVLLATSHYFLGEAEPAIAEYRRGIAGYAAAHGIDDVYTASFRVGLGWALLAGGRVDEARDEFEAGRAAIAAKLGDPSEATVDAQLGLVAVALAERAPERARSRLESLSTVPLEDLNRIAYELFDALLADEPLEPVRERARAIDGGEATLAVLLASVRR